MTAFACCLALFIAGTNIDISKAMMAMTTKSSINVNPPVFLITNTLSFGLP